jgi:hypothetical protein
MLSICEKFACQFDICFNSDKSNLVRIAPMSEVKIESLYKVYLAKGKVFALIKELKRKEDFEIRTPVAISGARGTGWSSEYNTGKARINCFEDVIYVEGINNGKVTGRINVNAGFGVEVGPGGILGELFSIPASERNSWRENKPHGLGGVGGNIAPEDVQDTIHSLKEEARENYRQQIEEDLREQRENYGSEGDDSQSGGDGGDLVYGY